MEGVGLLSHPGQSAGLLPLVGPLRVSQDLCTANMPANPRAALSWRGREGEGREAAVWGRGLSVLCLGKQLSATFFLC